MEARGLPWNTTERQSTKYSRTFKEFPVCNSFFRISPVRERDFSLVIKNHST